MNNHQTGGKNRNDTIAVCIMPWAGLREEIQVGSVRFWPWDENRVSDSAVREQLNRYFNCFVDRYGKCVETITICSHGEPDFRILSNLDEYNEICSAVDILIFSAICPQTKIGVCSNNQSVGPPTADRYQLINQKMKPPNDNIIAIGTESIISLDQMDKVHISKPWGVGGPFGTHPDKEFINAFDKVFSKEFPLNIRERIFRSLDFFRIAHTEADLGLNQPVGTASLSKLVMMATAFEILLEFPESPKSKYFAEQVENRIKTDEFLMEARVVPKNKLIELSMAGWWAWDFYKLRNRIVHGDSIGPEELKYKEWITYNIVADLVFWEFIKRELYEQGRLGERVRKWTKEFEPVTDAAPDVIEDIFAQWILGFEDVHRAFGWIPPLRATH